MKHIKVSNRIWEKALVFCGVLCTILPTSPWIRPSVHKDSGVFLYIGWRILHGEIPYINIWDHKPPVIFYINALGLSISDHSRWGVWLIEFVAVLFAAFLGFNLIKRAMGIVPAILSLFLWLLTLVFINAGNFTEEYALPLQFAALWLIYDINEPAYPKWRLLLIGLLGALAFFTKQTTSGIWIAIIVYLVVRMFKSGLFKQWLYKLLLVLTGGILFASMIVIYFGIKGVLQEFWSAAFIYNFVYSASFTSWENRLVPLISGITPLISTGIFQLAIMGFVVAIILIISRKNIVANRSSLLIIGIIDLPMEFFLASSSGRAYPHYYITMLPVLSIFTGILLFALYSWITALNIQNKVKGIFVIGMVGIFLWSSLVYFRQLSTNGNNNINNSNDAITYIESTTEPDDFVLLWGAETSINYLSQRKSPTRFVYQYPLYQSGYVDAEMISQFLEDIIKNHPKLIIDTRNSSTPLYDFPIQTSAIDEKIETIRSHYRAVTKIGEWVVYKYVEDNLVPARLLLP